MNESQSKRFSLQISNCSNDDELREKRELRDKKRNEYFNTSG